MATGAVFFRSTSGQLQVSDHPGIFKDHRPFNDIFHFRAGQ
jgi:hypothetical protein